MQNHNRSTPGKRVRWVGFDMDECIGSLMPVWPYCDYLLDHLQRDRRYAFLEELANRLVAANAASRIWVLRPELDIILRRLVEAKQAGEIVGCFILSNNASLRLVEVARLMMNARARKLTGNQSPLFLVGWHRTAPCRLRRTTKSWDMIQHCLKASGYPQASSKRDLLFYDDLAHILGQEIPHYVQVPPYFYVTPHKRIYDAIQSLIADFDIPDKSVASAIREGDGMERQEVIGDREMSLTPPPTDSKKDIDIFINGLEAFLQNGHPTPPSTPGSPQGNVQGGGLFKKSTRRRGHTRKIRHRGSGSYTRKATTGG